MVMNVDNLHASFARVNRAAMLTLAPALVVIELLEQRRQILNNAFQLYFRAIDQLVAVRAVPFEGVQNALGAWHFHDHTDGFSRPLRRMAQMLGQKEYFALFDRYFQRR